MRLKITLAYAGTAYAGWQLQPDAPTIQGAVEAAATTIAGRPIRVHGAGRTDAGVHAEGQVAHLDVPDRLSADEWLRALNAVLATDIRVLRAAAAPGDFHARYGAVGKSYVYRVDDRSVASPFTAAIAWHVPGPLDADAMRCAAAHLEGPVDQRAFATQPIDGGRPNRPLERVELGRSGDLLELRFAGRSFLRYAVRGMVGTLAEVGLGRRSVDSIADLAISGDRAAAGVTAPPHGLCLAAVHYEPAAQPRV